MSYVYVAVPAWSSGAPATHGIGEGQKRAERGGALGYCDPTFCAERKEPERAQGGPVRKGWGTHSVVRDRNEEPKAWGTRPSIIVVSLCHINCELH
jgi:hypothetical protein